MTTKTAAHDIVSVTGATLDNSGRRLLGPLDFNIKSKGITLLLGPNGSGKTLLLKTLNNLIKPSAGTILRPPMIRCAMVFQNPLMLRRSVAANLDYPLRVRNISRQKRRHSVAHMLELSGLKALAQRYAPTLSGGECQKVALARAWIAEPTMILLDEPCASLDPAATRAAEILIQKISSSNVKIIMTTHDMHQARRLADEIMFIHHGQIKEQAPAQQFFTAPSSNEARNFLDGNLLVD